MKLTTELYRYECAEVYCGWLVVPFQVANEWATALLSPQEIEPLYADDETWSTVPEAIAAGKVRIEEMEVELARDMLEEVVCR